MLVFRSPSYDFNLARWLLHTRADAEDVAQETLLRACLFYRGFHGGDARPWLLQIVRNTCYSWLEKNRRNDLMVEFDEELHPQLVATPESIAIADEGRERLTRALETPATSSPRSSCASRARRLFLQEDRRDYIHSHWHRNVLALPCSSSVAVRTHKSWLQGTFAWTVILPARPLMGILTMR